MSDAVETLSGAVATKVAQLGGEKAFELVYDGAQNAPHRWVAKANVHNPDGGIFGVPIEGNGPTALTAITHLFHRLIEHEESS